MIGLEAACAAAKNGCRVTVIESEFRLLARAFPAAVSDLVAAKHRHHGVAFIFGATVTGTTPDGVQLSNGETIEADLVLVGIGVEPVPTLAERLGLPSRGGIAVDACGRTAAPGVFCAGDVALQWSSCHGRAIRVETWANAQNQAISVAGNMMGEAKSITIRPGSGPINTISTFRSPAICSTATILFAATNVREILRGSDARRGRGRRDVGQCCQGNGHVQAADRGNAKPSRVDIELPAYDLRAALK